MQQVSVETLRKGSRARALRPWLFGDVMISVSIRMAELDSDQRILKMLGARRTVVAR